MQAGNKRVIAVGTKFSVRRNGDDIRVVVTEGTVRLESDDAPHGVRGDRKPKLSPGSAPVLSGSSVGIDSSSGSADVVLLPVGSVAHAGSAGVLMFRDQALADAAAAEFTEADEVLEAHEGARRAGEGLFHPLYDAYSQQLSQYPKYFCKNH